MARLIVIALLVASTPLLAQSMPQEITCLYTVEDSDGMFYLEQAENLEVLAQVERTGKFALPDDAPPSVVALNCVRTSPIPVLSDRAVPDAGLILYIMVRRPSAPPLIALSLADNEYKLEVVSGRLSRREQAGVAEVLTMMNTVRADESSGP